MLNSNNVFGTAKPLEGNVSDWIAGQEKMDFAYREEQRVVDDIKAKKKEKEEELYAKRLEQFKNPTAAPTGIEALDKAKYDIIGKAIDETGKNQAQVRVGMSMDEFSKIKSKQDKLDSLPNRMLLAESGYKKRAEEINALVAAGKIKIDPDMMKRMSNIADGKVTFDIDENYDPIMVVWDGEGQDAKPTFIDYNDMVSGNAFGKTIPNADFRGAFQAIGKDVQTHKFGSDNGVTKRVTEKSNEELLKTQAKAALYNNKGEMTDIMQSKLWDMGYKDPLNAPESVLQAVEKEAVDVMKSFIKTSDVTDVTIPSERGGRGGDDDKNKPTWGVVEVPPVYAEAKVNAAKGYKAVSINGKVSIPTLSLPKKGGGRETLANVSLQSYSVILNGNGQRQIVAELYYDKVKSTRVNEKQGSSLSIDDDSSESSETKTLPTERAVRIEYLTEKDAKIMAQQLGFGSVNEMKDAARSGEPTQTQTQKKSAAPSKGQVVEGYIFLGGNPNDQKNWKKQ